MSRIGIVAFLLVVVCTALDFGHKSIQELEVSIEQILAECHALDKSYDAFMASIEGEITRNTRLLNCLQAPNADKSYCEDEWRLGRHTENLAIEVPHEKDERWWIVKALTMGILLTMAMKLFEVWVINTLHLT